MQLYLLDKKYAVIIVEGIKTIIGTRDTNHGIWSDDLTTNGTPLPVAHPYYVLMENSAYAQKTKTKLLDFLNRSAFSPSVPSWKKAFNNNFFATCTGLTSDYVQKFLSNSINTEKGHMKTTPKICNPPNPPCPFNMHPLL